MRPGSWPRPSWLLQIPRLPVGVFGFKVYGLDAGAITWGNNGVHNIVFPKRKGNLPE